jgi:DNA-binding IclR family transcriptional regulator
VIPSALSHAKADPRLRGAALAAYIFCLEYLDSQEWRPVKVEVLSRSIRCKLNTAVDALRTLVEAGYIARGERPHGEARHYRLLPAPLPVVKARAA